MDGLTIRFRRREVRCFQRDLERGFATVQRRLSDQALDKYTLPFGGGYYFVLPGADRSRGDYLGKSLFDAAV
ncbi:hypothetical protein AB0K15_21190 [Amycolatopsis sp. NPDC049253]|uniref:hypothetical protein n=1 Tax=Amycolatopsis sp. NPDC049253 TaxID=3155274 RepID=UPI003426FF49